MLSLLSAMIGAGVKQVIDKLNPEVKKIIDHELEQALNYALERFKIYGIGKDDHERKKELD